MNNTNTKIYKGLGLTRVSAKIKANKLSKNKPLF